MKRLECVNNKTKLFIPGPGARMCTQHFSEDIIYRLFKNVSLREDAIPTLFKTASDEELIVSKLNNNPKYITNYK